MADKPTDTKTFAQFLDEQPAPAETVTLAGYVTRCSHPGSFVLNTGGQTMELPAEAVKSYKVLSEGPQKLVELEVVSSKIDTTKIVKAVVTDVPQHKNPLADIFTHKEVTLDPIVGKQVHKDPILDPITIAEGHQIDPGPLATNPALAGLQPFVLATPHHAPASTIAAQMGAPAQLAHNTTPLRDYVTALSFDHPHTFKELTKDPLTDVYTLPETIFPDPTNTAAEGIGVQTGIGQVINPAVQMQALMAQAPQTAAGQFQGAQLASTPLTDVITVAYFDRPNTLPWWDHPHTIKEVLKDPITDPITIVENLPGGGGGTLQEGVAGGGSVINPVWNLPGMMF